jgi:hypothetical protein
MPPPRHSGSAPRAFQPVGYVNSSAVRKCPFAARSYLRTPHAAKERQSNPSRPPKGADPGPQAFFPANWPLFGINDRGRDAVRGPLGPRCLVGFGDPN